MFQIIVFVAVNIVHRHDLMTDYVYEFAYSFDGDDDYYCDDEGPFFVLSLLILIGG